MEEKREETMPEKEKKNIKDKEKELKEKEKEIASDLKAEAAEIDKSLSEVIREQATEDEAPQSRTFSLRKILGGDILSTSFMRRQIWLFLLIALFIVVYIANRYSCQQDIIEIDALQKELKDAKYKALSSNSKLTEESRQSNVLDMLKENKDSTLKLPTQPPYIITVPDK
jgi:preprotein translocase subunit SecF